MRESRGPQIEGSVNARSRPGRRLWAGSLALLLPLVLVLVAVLAPIGQAHPAKERTPEELASRAQAKLAEKEQHAAQRQAQRELQAKLRGDGSKTVGRGEERENGLVKITCTQVSWTFKNFPDLPGNTVTERLSIGHAPPTFKTFTFDSTTGTDVVAISAPPAPGGHAYQIDAWENGRPMAFTAPLTSTPKSNAPPIRPSRSKSCRRSRARVAPSPPHRSPARSAKRSITRSS
jgi:hypothetical protein